MGLYVVKCKLCKTEIVGSDYLVLRFNEGSHEIEQHPEVYRHNKKVQEKFDKAWKKINDEKIKNEKIIFTKSVWDGEAMLEEKQ